MPEVLAQIHDLDRRHGSILDARIEAQQLVLSLARVMERFERRGRGGEQGHGAFQLGAHDGDVAAVVTRRFFLLVAGFLLLVDDDQAEILERREDCGARAHHDARFAAPHAPPFPRAVAVGKGAVQYRHSAVRRSTGAYFARRRLEGRSKSRGAQAAHPKRQRDFRHQHERGTIARQHRLDRLKVHFGFAAARNAEEQPGRKRTSVQPGSNFG